VRLGELRNQQGLPSMKLITTTISLVQWVVVKLYRGFQIIFHFMFFSTLYFKRLGLCPWLWWFPFRTFLYRERFFPRTQLITFVLLRLRFFSAL